MHPPGFEPEPRAWKALMLAVTLQMHNLFFSKRNLAELYSARPRGIFDSTRSLTKRKLLVCRLFSIKKPLKFILFRGIAFNSFHTSSFIMSQKHEKLFLPGPTEIRQEVLDILATKTIGYRDTEFKELFAGLRGKTQKLFQTQNEIFLSTSSGTGLMEAAVRNCVDKKCLNLVNGHFGERWRIITQTCGKESVSLEAEWGQAIKPNDVREKLESENVDAITLVHSETSTGVFNPLKEISDVVKDFPDVSFLVDSVSSMAATDIKVDQLSIDVCLTSSQKAIAVSPGISMCSVSESALEKSLKIKNKGVYFDFQVFKEAADKNLTPETPALPQFFAFDFQLDRIFKEGLENRFFRHDAMAQVTREWAKENFALFPEQGFEATSLTVVENTKGIDFSKFSSSLKEKGFVIAPGYSKLVDKTFRIGHMGDLTVKEVKELITVMDETLGEL